MKWRYSMHLFASLGELWLGRHDLAKARALGNECLELATRTQSRKYLVRGWRLVGEIAVADHDSGDAEVALQRALAVAMAIGNPTQLWKTHVACGRLYRATGRPDAAQKALALARETAARIKAQLSSADARATFEQSPLIRPVYAEGGSSSPPARSDHTDPPVHGAREDTDGSGQSGEVDGPHRR